MYLDSNGKHKPQKFWGMIDRKLKLEESNLEKDDVRREMGGIPGDRRRQNFFEIEVITLGNPLIFCRI